MSYEKGQTKRMACGSLLLSTVLVLHGMVYRDEMGPCMQVLGTCNLGEAQSILALASDHMRKDLVHSRRSINLTSHKDQSDLLLGCWWVVASDRKH